MSGTDTEQFDVRIVGAGPAGLTAGIHGRSEYPHVTVSPSENTTGRPHKGGV